MSAQDSLIPFSDPSEPAEYERTTAGRKPCPSCGEWVYPQRPIGLQRGFAFPPNCPVCGAVLPVNE
jgi:predicted RNA-binding Zn-ribbon protein involved in translation (DUF1610 family)